MKKFKIKCMVVGLCGLSCLAFSEGPSKPDLILYSGGAARYSIIIPDGSSETVKYAAEELHRYLGKMTGADFVLGHEVVTPSIILSDKDSFARISKEQLPVGADFTNNLFASDGFAVMVRGENIYLVGANSRNVLYAVYDFLERLGCKWLAPDFAVYRGRNEYVPYYETLSYLHPEDVVEKPSMEYRKLFIEEGLSHNLVNLKQMIEWMPKAKFNVLVCPLDYQGQGRVCWDRWKDELTPELRKRGILIEVGGHGHMNFISAEKDNGRLFKAHPEWFAMDKDGKRTDNHSHVICSSNKDAVDYLKKSVLSYLKQHPEIDIFDFWPPDGVRWCTCPECAKLGSPSDRIALINTAVVEYLKTNNIQTRIEYIGYASVETPSEKVKMDRAMLIDLCPFKQDFTKYIYDPTSKENASFMANVYAWKKNFDGDIGIYSYYRKYMWRSLPVMLPHYMQEEVRFYKSIGIKGIYSYAEPGDWFTYELTLYALSKIAWNTDVDIDAAIQELCVVRYPGCPALAKEVFEFFENTARFYCSIPQTDDRPAGEYAEVLIRIDRLIARVNDAEEQVKTCADLEENLRRLQLQLDYMRRDVQLQQARINGVSKENRQKMVGDLLKFLEANTDRGIFAYRNHVRFNDPAKVPPTRRILQVYKCQ